MIYAVVALAVTALGSLTYAMHRVSKAADRIGDARDHEADARIAQVATEAELEREKYEHDQTKRALSAADARADALEEVLSDAINATPNADLDRADVQSRVLRIAQRWAAADAASRLPAAAVEAVPADAAAEASVPDMRNPDGPDV